MVYVVEDEVVSGNIMLHMEKDEVVSENIMLYMEKKEVVSGNNSSFTTYHISNLVLHLPPHTIYSHLLIIYIYALFSSEIDIPS